jgi:hypothetical protein
MAEGRGKMEWAQTSCLMALVVNILRDPKKGKSAKPADFNPYFQRKNPVQKVTMKELKTMLGSRTREVMKYGGSKQ